MTRTHKSRQRHKPHFFQVHRRKNPNRAVTSPESPNLPYRYADGGGGGHGVAAGIQHPAIGRRRGAARLLRLRRRRRRRAFACEIAAAHRGGSAGPRHRPVRLRRGSRRRGLASSGRLPRFLGALLSVSPSPVDLLPRASDLSLRAAGAGLVVGDRVAERVFEAADAWDGVRAEVIPGKRRVDLYLEHDSQRYKLEVLFEDMKDCLGCTLDGMGAILLQVSCRPYCSL